MNERSKEWYQRALRVIPGGVNSPVRSFKYIGIDPIFFARADGPYLFDVDGNSYIDFCLSFGPHLLGHSHPVVVNAIKEQAERATSFGACTPKEVEMAELILRIYPFLQKVRLVSSGTEAVMTALRVARGYTGRSKILKFEGCYHGHSDGLLVKSGSGVAALSESASKGVPESIIADTLIARYDSLESIEQIFQEHGHSIAALIVEPIPANYGLWIPPYSHIKQICQLAKSFGTLVIFDEVITGFRAGLAGATGYYDLRPDLVTLGKVIGAGLPLAALAGREEIMNCLAPVGEVYQAGTLSGNPLATAAGCAVIEKLIAEKGAFGPFDKLCENFAASLRKLLGAIHEVEVTQLNSLFWIRFGEKTNSFPPEMPEQSQKPYREFFVKALREGIYLPPSPYEVAFLSFAHTESVLDEALEKLKRCLR